MHPETNMSNTSPFLYNPLNCSEELHFSSASSDLLLEPHLDRTTPFLRAMTITIQLFPIKAYLGNTSSPTGSLNKLALWKKKPCNPNTPDQLGTIVSHLSINPGQGLFFLCNTSLYLVLSPSWKGHCTLVLLDHNIYKGSPALDILIPLHLNSRIQK